MRSLILAAVLGSSIAAAGCHHHHTAPGAHRARAVHHGAVVTIPATHVHSAHCGHYQYRGNWHHSSGHVHGQGCGHHHRGGHWVHED